MENAQVVVVSINCPDAKCKKDEEKPLHCFECKLQKNKNKLSWKVHEVLEDNRDE